MPKYSVFMTYGVYVDSLKELTDEEIIEDAIETIKGRSAQELRDGDFEIEDVTKEFGESEWVDDE